MDNKNFPRSRQNALYWLSTLMFVFIALMVRVLTSVQVAYMMRFFHIRFRFHPLGNMMERGGYGNWTDWKTILVFGMAPLLGVVIGFLILRLLVKVKSLSWRLRLFMVWMAFILIHLLPMGMLAGVFIYDDFGFAFSNIFIWKLFRLGLSLVVVAIAIAMRPYWLKMFYTAASSHKILNFGMEYRLHVIMLPWLTGTAIIGLFALPAGYLSWFVVYLLMGLVILPFYARKPGRERIRLVKSESSEVWRYRITPWLWSALLLLLLGFHLYRLWM